MKIMIIGGTNFIGSVVASCLEKQGHNITLFHREKSHSLHYTEIQGDCESPDALKKGIELVRPDMIIHMIALYQSHIEALEKALGGQKMKLLLISSVDVYKGFEVFNKLSSAPIEPIPFTEKSPLRDILDQHLVVDSTKIRKKLGFTETISLETGLLNTIQWEVNPNLV